jgi:hypothetical protein
MTRDTMRCAVAATLFLGMSSLAFADDGERSCRLSSLNGRYIFAASGFTIVAGVPQPKAILELIDFAGDGTLVVPGGTRSVNGIVTQGLVGAGTYTIAEDCTGTISFNGPPSFDLFLDRPTHELRVIQTNPNSVFLGTATRTTRDRDEH